MVNVKNDPRICQHEECGKDFLAKKSDPQKFCSKQCYHASTSGKSVNNGLRTLKSYVEFYGDVEGLKKYNERIALNDFDKQSDENKYVSTKIVNGKVIRSKEYNSFAGIKARCNNPKNPYYEYYGGRGISVSYTDFKEFLDDVGFAPSPSHSIDRINNELGYELGNCRWATKAEQLKNTRKTIHVLFNGEKMCLKDLSKKMGVSYGCLRKRLKKGKDLFAPLQEQYSNKKTNK